MQAPRKPVTGHDAADPSQNEAEGRKGFTFVVEANVKPGGPFSYGKDERRLSEPRPNDSLPDAWRTMGGSGGSIEAMSPAPLGTVAVFTKQNLFVKAVHAAFFDHHTLVLSPDVIWLTIAQGLANHIDQNAEFLREKLVSHEGKKELMISRPEFVKGSPENDWEGVFPEFSALIKANSVEGTTELIENDFSTTGPVERVVSHITLMDAVQHYFTYTMCCGCGFPSITLTGDLADWEKIRAKAAELERYGLEWWLEDLLPALDQFVAAASGEPNLDFWRSLCMINVGTSFPQYKPLTGWVQVFFPYLINPGRDSGDRFTEATGPPKKALVRNEYIGKYMESFHKQVNVDNFPPQEGWAPPQGVGRGVDLKLFPPAMSSAPFTYEDATTGNKHKMAFFGGITCLVQHEDGAIEPKMGWAVLDSGRLSGNVNESPTTSSQAKPKKD